jgi:hypothetical protein
LKARELGPSEKASTFIQVMPELAKRFPLSRPKRSWEAGTQGLIQIRPKSGYCSLSRSLFWPPDAAQIPPGKIKFDARNFQKSVGKFKVLKKISNFFRISGKKLP